ncbi:3-oxoadipate enol-lactonase [Methylobacterium sp. Leaf125]|uniref:3-oxoadipate enol-lactonase n=1 Tax=Methylobacterium sp. Leaf125 TaxID=1736265 RepID=UPI0006F4B8A1|nr:3-oxoadipate enol-lactonase [Methylobacterium sp. Leaf125]KQQ26353.1 3-oxoadipate enol-lactonase [Methylobacterium sp. Leaf125]
MPQAHVAGLAMNYDLTGPSDAPVVAFSHSLGATLTMWDGMVTRLCQRYRVLRYDIRGHGGSATHDAPVEITDLARDLTGLLDILNIPRAHIVGLSLGGMIGQALAGAVPERPLSLTLMATSAHLPSEATWTNRAATARTNGMAAIVEPTLERWFTPGFASRAPAVIAPIRAAFIACDPVGYATACGAIGRMDLRPQLARVVAPTLILAGRDDPSTPPTMAEEICAGIPQAELVLLPQAAHMLSVERPEAVASYLLGFLDRHSAG